MGDMYLREKIKKVVEASKQGEHIPNRSKNIGLLIFLILFACGVLTLFALAIGLMLNGHFIISTVLLLVGLLLTYSIVKMITADNIQPL